MNTNGKRAIAVGGWDNKHYTSSSLFPLSSPYTKVTLANLWKMFVPGASDSGACYWHMILEMSGTRHTSPVEAFIVLSMVYSPELQKSNTSTTPLMLVPNPLTQP